MACSNCFNGCTEIVSDQCVKYTGIDVPVLGIQTGDSLSYVEQALITFLTSTLDGTGIIPNINTGSAGISCNLVSQYLPVCGEITIVDLVSALIQASCDLQGQVDVVVAELATLNDDYIIDCLTGVSASSDTHIVLQAVIDNLCFLNGDVVALTLDLTTNYVKITDIDAYIAAWMAANNPNSLISNKMVPYVAVEYYGDITGKFDITGAGLGDWDKIYLCNGVHGTPDKRGRIPIGVTTGTGGGAFNVNVDPAIAGNPTYTLNTTHGANTITLSPSQMPIHTHANTAASTISPNPHSHDVQIYAGTDSSGSHISAGVTGSPSGTHTGDVTLSVTTALTNVNTGGSLSHENIPPVLACYYIMFIP